MSDQGPYEPGQDGAALPPELARVERLLLAEGKRWRQAEPSTGRLEAHLRALIAPAGSQTGREGSMLSEHEAPYQDAPTLRTPPRPPSRWRGPLALVATLLLLAMTASVFTLLRLQPTTGAGHEGTPATPTPALVRLTAPKPADTRLPLSGGDYLADLSFSSARDGWAAGGVIAPAIAPQAALVHYRDGVWEAAADAFPGVSLTGVSMVSASDGWAVGSRPRPGASEPVVLRYTDDGTGGHWAEINAPQLAGDELRTVHMLSADSGYMIGQYYDPNPANPGAIDQYVLIVVYQNGVWTPVKTTVPAYSAQVAMVSDSEGWAAQVKDLTVPGGVENQQTTLYHYLNGAWTPVQTFSGAVTSLSAQSQVDVWLLATQCVNCTESTPRIEHYNGSTWSRIQPPNINDVPQGALVGQMVYDGGASGVWVSYVIQDTVDPTRYYTTTWHGGVTGWTLAGASPLIGQLVALTADHSGGMWAITQSQSAGPLVTTVYYWQGSAWVVYGQN